MTYTDIWAGNKIEASTGQWKEAVEPYKEQDFNPNHTKKQAVGSFLNRNSPKEIPITEEEFIRLAGLYQSEAERT